MARKTPLKGYGRRVLAAREAAGFTQAELAAILKLKRGRVAISDIEREIHDPRFSVMCDIADALAVSLDYLRGKSDEV